MTQILTSATSVTGIYAHHLRRHWAVLEQQPELAKALDRVMSAVEPVQLDPILAYKLSSMGLLKQSGDKVAKNIVETIYFNQQDYNHGDSYSHNTCVDLAIERIAKISGVTKDLVKMKL